MDFCFRDLHFLVSVLSLQGKAKLEIQSHNPSFNASRDWIRKFFNRHKLATRAQTLIDQELPKQLEGVLNKFCEDAAHFMRTGKYPLFLVRNKDETSALFDMVPSKSILKICERDCAVRSSGSEKKTSDCCFVSHRWTDASTHDYFQRKN